MTEPPTPDEDPHAAPEPQPKKGRGCLYGGLATVGAVIGGLILGGIALAVITSFIEAAGSSGLADDISGFGSVLVVLLPIGLLVGAGIIWRKTPGFLLGIGLTIGISLAVGTACATLLFSTA
jgi:hypothetical protein